MVAWQAYACRLLDPGKGITSVPAGRPPAEAARPSGSSWATDDVLPALTRRAAELEARIASIEAEIRIEQQRIASYAEHGRSLEAALADAYRGAHAIRERARSDADRILAHAVEERRMLHSDVGRLREEQVGLEDEITSLRRDRLIPLPPSYEFAEPAPVFDLQASIAEEMRLLLAELIEEFRARPLQAEPEIVIAPPSDVAETEVEAVPVTSVLGDVIEPPVEELDEPNASPDVDDVATTDATLEDWDEIPSAQAPATAPYVEVSAEPAATPPSWTEFEEGGGPLLDAVASEPSVEPTLEDWDEMPSAQAPSPVVEAAPPVADQVQPVVELGAPPWTEVEETVGPPIQAVAEPNVEPAVEDWDEMPSAQAPSPVVEAAPPVADQVEPVLELEAPSWTEVDEALRLRMDALTSAPNVEPVSADWDETPAAPSTTPAADLDVSDEASAPTPVELTPEPWSPVDDEVDQVDSPMPSWTETMAEPEAPVPPPSWDELPAAPLTDSPSEIERSEATVSPWDEVEIAPAASVPTEPFEPVADFAPAPPLEADVPQPEADLPHIEMVDAPVEPVAPLTAAPQSEPAPRQIGLVVSPVHSFPHLLEIQRRVQSLSTVRGLQLRDFRNGVATFAVGVAESITPREFGAVVQMLESLKLRLEDASENSVELRVEDAPSSD